MESKQLNEKESLELITSMIRNTQNNLENRGWVTMVSNGYITIGISLLIYFLLYYTHNWHYNFIWLGIPLFICIFSYFERKKHPKRMTTYIDRVVGKVWIVLGITAWLASCVAFIKYIPILFIIALIINIGTATTGLIIKFKALAIGGFIGILLAFSLLFISDINSILIFSSIFLFCMVIPGHILQYAQNNRLKQQEHV